MPGEDRSNSIERALSIIETAAKSSQGLSNADISRKLGIPKSSASYILRILEKRGYLLRGENGKYRLGLKLIGLTGGLLTNLDIRETARPLLEDFLEKSKLSEAHLAILDNGRAVYIEKVESGNSFIKMGIFIGQRLPIHTTAIGKALAAYLPEADVSRILETHGMEKKTSRSISSPERFIAELGSVRKKGYAIDDEENSENVRCLAAPIFNADGKCAAAIGASSIAMQMDAGQLPKIAEMVKASALLISKSLGFSG